MPLPGTGPDLGRSLVRLLAEATDAAAATAVVLRELARSTGASLVVLWLHDEDVGLLRWQADHATDGGLDQLRSQMRRLTFPPGTGVPGTVLATLEDVVLDDLRDPSVFPRASVVAAAGLRRVTGVPVLAREGTIGVLELFDAVRPDAGADAARLAARQLAAFLGQLRVEDRLRAMEEESASIVRAALDAIVTMDHEGRVLDFNPAAEATFGYRHAEACGRLLAELVIPPELRPAHERGLADYLRTGRGRILDQRLELSAVRADGSMFPVELTVARLGTREPPRFVGFLRDITDRHESERQHDRLLTQAVTARALAEASQTRSDAAHAAAEAANMRLAFLAQAGERMLASRDPAETMRNLVELVVPAVADWCTIALEDSRGSAGVAVTHGDEQLAHFSAAGVEELVAESDPSALLVVPLSTPERAIGRLVLAMGPSGRRFGPDDETLARGLAGRAALAIENARLFTERSHIADTLQRSLLPTGLPDIPKLDVAARYRAAGEQNLVGGDFYDVFRSADGIWTAVLGDVSGKGPEAAALTALTRHTLRAGSLRERSPRANLLLLNDALLANHRGSALNFATVLYARICPKERGALVTVSTGGHPPPVVVRADGSVETVVVAGTLLGALAEPPLDEVDVALAPGDTMLLYTDGVTEVRTTDPQYGDRLLMAVLVEQAGATAEEIVTAVEREAVGAQAGEPRDDIALIAIRALPD